VVEVGRPAGPVWQATVGRLTYEDGAPEVTLDTIYDLASLTKVLATASLAMRQVEAGRIDIDEPVGRFIPGWHGGDRDSVRIRDLLAHASGLPGFRPYHESMAGREAFERAICAEPLVYAPRTDAVYSDLGFMLLGFLLADTGGAALDAQFDDLLAALSSGTSERDRARPASQPIELRYRPPASWFQRTAPTRMDAASGHPRRGEVDDPNALALGGVAGHAGLFGTAPAVGWFAREVLGTYLGLQGSDGLARPETVRRFAARSVVSASSRALAWDTMLPTSSCGARMSRRAFGHTGFTGTSLWIDPEAQVYVVLLTNRVHPAAGPGQAIADVRRALHDLVMEEMAR
jgi:CubicO group peptidase (beta-lactamase class C family)